MKKTIIAALFMAIVPGLSLAEINEDFRPRAKESSMRLSTRDSNTPREHTIDPYRVERAKNRETFYKECRNKEFDNFYLQEKCFKDAGINYRKAFPDRGTHAYGEKTYADLTSSEGREKRDELLQLLDVVSFYPKPGNDESELTVKHIRQEMHYIERYVMKISPREYETR